MLVEAPSLAALPGVRHAFFTREGGVSEGVFDSLSMGLRSGDEPGRVAENRRRATERLGFEPTALVTLRQVHGADCLPVTGAWSGAEPPEADALATDRPGLLLGVLTADCVPVLFADPVAGVIGAAHAGWKGALAGVVERTLACMGQLGAEVERCVTVIGPAIAQASYEVGPELEERFTTADPAFAEYFAPVPGSDRRLFDLKGLVALRLRRAGVCTVSVLAHDTYGEEGRFFSFRRATKRQESCFGVQLSAIGLSPR
jgi:YfiH family protein